MTNSAEQASVSIEKPVTNHNKRSTANTALPPDRYLPAQDTISPAAWSILNRGAQQRTRATPTPMPAWALAFFAGSAGLPSSLTRRGFELQVLLLRGSLK